MTAPDPHRLATATIGPCQPIELGPCPGLGAVTVYRAGGRSLHYRARLDNWSATVRGSATDYQGVGTTPELAMMDALACRAEYESEAAPTVSAAAQLPLF